MYYANRVQYSWQEKKKKNMFRLLAGSRTCLYRISIVLFEMRRHGEYGWLKQTDCYFRFVVTTRENVGDEEFSKEVYHRQTARVRFDERQLHDTLTGKWSERRDEKK